MLNKTTLKGQCFYMKLVADSVAFLPEGLFDNLSNLQYLWANSSLSSLFSRVCLFALCEGHPLTFCTQGQSCSR